MDEPSLHTWEEFWGYLREPPPPIRVPPYMPPAPPTYRRWIGRNTLRRIRAWYRADKQAKR